MATSQEYIWQYRTINGYRLCRTLACVFSVILHKFCLTGVSLPALNLYNLTKNLTAQSHDNNYAVLPYKEKENQCPKSDCLIKA